MAFEAHLSSGGIFPLLLALFHPTFLSSWSSLPTSSPRRVAAVPSLSGGSLGALVPFPVPSRGRWERAGITPSWELRIFTKRHFSGRKAPGVGRAVGLTAPVPPPQLGLGSHSSRGHPRSLDRSWSDARCPWRWRDRNQPWIAEESLLEHQELRAELPRESHTPQTTHPSHCQSSSSLVRVDGGFLEFLARAPSSRVPNAAPSSTEALLKRLLAEQPNSISPFTICSQALLPGRARGQEPVIP